MGLMSEDGGLMEDVEEIKHEHDADSTGQAREKHGKPGQRNR